jgi:sorbitol/mannitol transport system substrate-binding protein
MSEQRSGYRGRRIRRTRRRTAILAAAITVVLVSTGCSHLRGAGGTGGGSDSINVLMVNNPQMIDIQKLTAENFTKQTGIKVNYTVLPENDVRDKISQELSSQAGIYDISTISNYEVPFYAKAGWLAPLSDYVAADSAGGAVAGGEHSDD